MANSERPEADPAGVTHAVEVEHKYEIPPGFTLPDLAGLPGVQVVAPPVQEDLDATYLDSPDLRLAAARHALRRRTGGHDAGWHLKRSASKGPQGVGAGTARDELHYPLGRSSRAVPAPLRAQVEVFLRGSRLAPVVRLSTTRTLHRLLDAQGVLLAEVALDDVIATLPKPGSGTTSWQELEVELVAGDPRLLKAAGKRLVAAGATPSASSSKLARALATLLPEVVEKVQKAQEAQKAQAVPSTGAGSAGAVIHAYLAGQVAHLLAHDPLVRQDAPDAVHQMRVACRRLRSLLGTFGSLFDRTVIDPVREELAWLGGELGAARDAEVTRDHLRQAALAQPAELLIGPVVERIVTTMNERYRAAHDEALTELGSRRYFTLLDTLDALVAAPPLTDRAQGDATEVLLPLLRRTWSRTRRLVAAADQATTGPDRDLHLHEVRKAAKRARYAGEALVDAFGKGARRYAAQMAAIQEALGDHQDSVVIRERLLELAAAATQAGESAFTYGRLHAQEQARGEQTDSAFAAAWSQAQAAEHLARLG